MQFNKGMIVQVIDHVDPTIVTIGTIGLVEPDDQFRGLSWLYIVANDESLNTHSDPRIGMYWDIRPNTSNEVMVLSYGTTQ